MIGTNDGAFASEKWYSSSLDTQQQETGTLVGILSRNNEMRLTPSNVSEPTASYIQQHPNLLSMSDSYALPSARQVQWPLQDGGTLASAYAWLSSILVNYDFYKVQIAATSTSSCPVPTCNDLRFYYTSGS